MWKSTLYDNKMQIKCAFDRFKWKEVEDPII